MLDIARPCAAAIFAKRGPLALAGLGAALLLLTGCGMPTAARPPGGTARPVFSVNMPLDTLASDPAAKAILFRDVPGVMNNPRYPLFEDMSLTQLAVISAGRLSKEKLDVVQADFDKLAAQ